MQHLLNNYKDLWKFRNVIIKWIFLNFKCLGQLLIQNRKIDLPKRIEICHFRKPNFKAYFSFSVPTFWFTYTSPFSIKNWPYIYYYSQDATAVKKSIFLNDGDALFPCNWFLLSATEIEPIPCKLVEYLFFFLP